MRTILFRLIGILEVSGGLYGVVAMALRLLRAHDSLVAVAGLVLFGFVLAAGVMLLEGSERGFQWSRWAQLLQVPLIATPVFSYALHSGAFVNVFVTLHGSPQLALDWHLATQGFGLALGGPATSRVGINLLALLSWMALRLR